MIYIVNMASGEPYPDDELVHHHQGRAKDLYPARTTVRDDAALQMQLAAQEPTSARNNTPASVASQHISALLQSLEG